MSRLRCLSLRTCTLIAFLLLLSLSCLALFLDLLLVLLHELAELEVLLDAAQLDPLSAVQVLRAALAELAAHAAGAEAAERLVLDAPRRDVGGVEALDAAPTNLERLERRVARVHVLGLQLVELTLEVVLFVVSLQKRTACDEKVPPL